MFNTAINGIEPFAGNRMCETITAKWVEGDDIGGDLTMLATMRSLLYARRGDRQFHFRFLSLSTGMLDAYPDANRALQDLTGNKYNRVPTDTLILINRTGGLNLNDIHERLTKSEQNAWIKDNGCINLTAPEKYIQQRTGKNNKIYVFPALNSAVILATNLSQAMNHLIQSFLPLYFPSLFAENRITEEEKAMLETLTRSNPNKYREAIAFLAKDLDINGRAAMAALADFEASNCKTMLAHAENELQQCKDRAEAILENYELQLRHITESVIRCEGLRAMLENTSDSKELVDYFTAHKNIKILNIEDSIMELIVNAYIDTFDVNGYEHISINRDIYRHFDVTGEFSNEGDRKLFMDHIFSEDPDFKIKTCAYYKLDLNGSVRSSSYFDYASRWIECKDRIPNPHLNIHRCIGGNQPLIEKQLRDGEIMGAVECCIASAMAVNVHETGATFRPFLQEIMRSTNPVLFNTRTNTDMTPLEALAWLKDKYEKQQEKKEA